MVMIDLGHEKKSLGVISVTRVTESLLLRHIRVRRSARSPQVKSYEMQAVVRWLRPFLESMLQKIMNH